jgi:hypothetical protein
MPRGGTRPRAGRKKIGVPNKATIEGQEQARIHAENAAAEASGDAAEAAIVARKKLAKDVLEEFMLRFGDMAAYHQPGQVSRMTVIVKGGPLLPRRYEAPALPAPLSGVVAGPHDSTTPA